MHGTNQRLPRRWMFLIPVLIANIPRSVMFPSCKRRNFRWRDVEFFVPADLLLGHVPLLARHRASPLTRLEIVEDGFHLDIEVGGVGHRRRKMGGERLLCPKPGFGHISLTPMFTGGYSNVVTILVTL